MIPVAAPIQARCRRCGGDFFLFEVVEATTGECPRCHWPLSPDWTPVLRDEARRADVAQRQLVSALRRLVGLPGNVEILPHSVLRNLFEEIGWERALAAEPGLITEEVRRLREQVEAWERLIPAQSSMERASIAQALRRLGDRLRRLGRGLDARQDVEAGGEEKVETPAGQAAREAAAELDAAADAVAAGGERPEQVLASLEHAQGVASSHAPEQALGVESEPRQLG